MGKSYMSDVNSKHLVEFCSIRGCKNKASIVLRVQYVNKIGSFCDSCADYCLRDGLAVNFISDDQ